MLRFSELVVVSTVLVLTGCASFRDSGIQKPKPPQVDFALKRVVFQIGDSTIHAQMRRFGSGDLTMVNLHDDEQTSVEAGVAVLEKIGGRLIELTHSGERRVVFSLHGNKYSFDPNRIFSPVGVRKTVTGQGNAAVPGEAYLAVERFGQQFLHFFRLQKESKLIALHNNTDGGLSVHTYEPGGDWAADTDELHVSRTVDPDDFFFVTDKRVYEALKQQDANVILQDNSIKRDDGSLSVYAGRQGIRYVNVESQPDHLAEQVRMVDAVAKIIR